MENKDFLTVPYTRELQELYARKFDCGNDLISSILKSEDSLRDMVGKTYVMLDEGRGRIIGYYNISTGDLADGSYIRLGGSIYIKYFAVDCDYQDTKWDDDYIADVLLVDCMNRIMEIREKSVGFAFVTLSSTKEGLHLYERNDFSLLEDDMILAQGEKENECIPMYLPIDYE